MAIALGLDRAAVPMEEDLATGEVPTTRRKARQRPYRRQRPERVNVHYRMAYVGTLSFLDADGESLGSRTADRNCDRRTAWPAARTADDRG